MEAEYAYPETADKGLKFKVKEAGLVHVITTKAGSGHLTSDGWSIVGRFYVIIVNNKWVDVILAKHHEWVNTKSERESMIRRDSGF